MTDKKDVTTFQYAEDEESSLISIDELVQRIGIKASPVLDEYLRVQAEHFLRYFQNETGKYLGDEAAREYKSYFRVLYRRMKGHEGGLKCSLKDIVEKIKIHHFNDAEVAIVNTTIIFPMRVVRAKRKMKGE